MPLSASFRPYGRLRTAIVFTVGMVSSVALAGAGFAQTAAGAELDRHLITPITQGKGPHETVERFQIAAGADAYRVPQAGLDALAEAIEARNRADARSALVNMAIDQFGLGEGVVAAMGTLAEQAAYLKSFGPVNTALNRLGLVIAVAQAARAASNGRTDEAVITVTKGLSFYAVGRWGSRVLQIYGVAAFVVDLTLSQVNAGALEIADDVQSCRYNAYYKAHGRSVHAWQKEALALYQTAEKSKDPGAFEGLLDAAVNKYVSLGFTSDAIERIEDCGVSQYGEMRSDVQAKIMARHKRVVTAMLAEKVLPGIADYAWNRTLRMQVKQANEDLVPILNRTFDLEVTAYDFDEGARVVIPLPNGGQWGGKLRDNGTFHGKITYYALMKAGFPDEVRLESGGESDTIDLVISEDRLSAVFGVPATPYVARYSLQESAQSCELKRMRTGEDPTFETQERPASSLEHLDMAVVVTPSGTPLPVQGTFNGTTWTLASPGRYIDGATLYGEPYLDNITALENCAFDMFSQGSMAEGDCTIVRYERKAVSAQTVMARTCTSTAEIRLEGIFATMGEGMQYYALDTPEGRAMITALRAAMGEYMPGFDASSLHISTPDTQ